MSIDKQMEAEDAAQMLLRSESRLGRGDGPETAPKPDAGAQISTEPSWLSSGAIGQSLLATPSGWRS